jgi:RND family efflux transporter MFP subunit
MDPPTQSPPQPLRWIGRDPMSFERVTAPPPASGSGTEEAEQVPQSSRIKWIAAAALAVIAVGAALVWKHYSPAVSQPLAERQSIPLVTVMAPGLTAVTSRVTFTGTIAARFDMPIGIEGDAGRIVAVNVEAGDRVKRGQVLARIDDSVLVPQVNRLAATLDQARAQASLSAAEYQRATSVAAAGALSAEDVEKRRATAITDEASVKVVAAQLAEAQARLNRTRVLAPESGIVLTRKAEVGQIASPGGEPLFRLASSGEIEMRGQVAEQDLAQLKVGQSASVYLSGDTRPFEGHVRLLGAVIDTQSRLGDIRISLQPDPALRPGAFARAAVTIGSAQRPILPQTAVLSDEQGTYVYVVNASNHVERRPVRVSGTTERGVIIAEGLTGKERIVATAGGFLREGEQVAVAPPPAAPAPATT